MGQAPGHADAVAAAQVERKSPRNLRMSGSARQQVQGVRFDFQAVGRHRLFAVEEDVDRVADRVAAGEGEDVDRLGLAGDPDGNGEGAQDRRNLHRGPGRTARARCGKAGVRCSCFAPCLNNPRNELNNAFNQKSNTMFNFLSFRALTCAAPVRSETCEQQKARTRRAWVVVVVRSAPEGSAQEPRHCHAISSATI